MGQLYTWQVIRLGDPPTRILEEGTVTDEEATTEFARDLLKSRWDGPSYRIMAGLKVKPEGVRFIDSDGSEILRYTVAELRKDGFMPRAGEDGAAE